MELPKLMEWRNGFVWCLICQVKTDSMATFETHKRMKQHIRSFTLQQRGQKSCYGCVACGLEFESPDLFEKHIRSIRHREKVYEKGAEHKLAAKPKEKKDIVYRCNICKFDTKSSEEYELHQYSAVHKSKEQFLAQSFKRKGSAKTTDHVYPPAAPFVTSAQSPSSASNNVPVVSKELASFVEGFDEHFLETVVEMKAFLEPFYAPSGANKEGVKLCRKCGEVLRQSRIWTHIYEAHLRVQPFTCHQCSAKFCAEEDLNRHAQFSRHDHDAPGNKDNELRILRSIFESRRAGANTPSKQEAIPVQDSTKERPGDTLTLPIIGPSDTPFVENGLRNFLMSQFPSSPKCLEKYSSASELRDILRPYFAKFVSTNARMTLECAHCRLEATNFWEHVYMMHLKSLPFKCADCSHRELTSHRIDRHCKSLGHQQEKNYEIALLKSALESVWPLPRTSGSMNVASASPSSLSSNSSSSSGYSSISARSGRTSVETDSSCSKRRSPERGRVATAIAQPPVPSPTSASTPALTPALTPASTRTPPKSPHPPRLSAFQPSSFNALPVASQPEEPNSPFISDDLRIFVISQLAPRTISDKEMRTRLEQHFHGFITKFIPLSESQSGADEKPANTKPMKFCTKCHKSFDAASLWLHIYEFHLLCKPFVCADCPVARLSVDELTKHCTVKGHQPDVLSEFKILRKVFFGKEIKAPTAKVDAPAPADVITLNDSPLKSAMKQNPNVNPSAHVLSSPSSEMRTKRPRMGVCTPKKNEVASNGNVATTQFDATSMTTTITMTTTTATTVMTSTTFTTSSSIATGDNCDLQSSSERLMPQKKARKTMPSSRKEAESILVSPTKEDSNRTLTPGKIRKRASMGGSAIPQKRKKMDFDETTVGDENSSVNTSDRRDDNAETAAVPTTPPNRLTTTTTISSTSETLVPRKKTARKMMKSKTDPNNDQNNFGDLTAVGAKETVSKVTIDGEEPTVSVELAAFLKTQNSSGNVVREWKKILKNYYLSAFMRPFVDQPGEVECSLCDSSFKKTLLLHHIYRHHLKVKPFACLDCPKRQTWAANLEKHCEDNDHSPDVDSESRFIREFFKHYGAASVSSNHDDDSKDVVDEDVDSSSRAADEASIESGDGAEASSGKTSAEGNRAKTKRKGREKEFRLEEVPSNLRPTVDDDLLEYITSRKLPRSAMTLDEYRMRLDSHFFAGCLTNPDRQSSHSLSQAFIIECAKCDEFCSQSDYWTHIYGEHLRTEPFACHGCDVTSSSYSAMEIHCLESNDCDDAMTIAKHKINSEELTLLKYLFNKTACAAFAENPPDSLKPQTEQDATEARDTPRPLGRSNNESSRPAKWKKRLRGRVDVANLNAISEQELAEMMSPQAMRNYMYEQNRRKAKDLKFLTCDHGCDYKTKDVAVYQHHIRRHNNQEAKFQCDIDGCSYNVNDKTQMTAHTKYHHKSKEEEQAVFATDHLDRLSLAPTEGGLFECPHCEYVVHHRRAAFQSHLSRHSMHSSAGQFYCSFCGFSGDSAEDINQHIKAHHKQMSNDVDDEEEEVTGTSRSGTQRRIQKTKAVNAKSSKGSVTRQPLNPEDPEYRQKLVSKYFLAPLSVSSLGLLTDEESGKRRRQHRAPIPTVSLKTAEWRNDFAAASDAELEAKLVGLMHETLGAGQQQQQQPLPAKPRTRAPAGAKASVQSNSNASTLVQIWESYPLTPSSPSVDARASTPSSNVVTRSSTLTSPPPLPTESFCCCLCPFVGKTEAEFERHVNQHSSLNDLVEELVVAEMNEAESVDVSFSNQETGREGGISNLVIASPEGETVGRTSGIDGREIIGASVSTETPADEGTSRKDVTDERTSVKDGTDVAEASVSTDTSLLVGSGARIDQLEVVSEKDVEKSDECINRDSNVEPPDTEPRENEFPSEASIDSVVAPIDHCHSTSAETCQNRKAPIDQSSANSTLTSQTAVESRIQSALTEVTSFRCSFCCHSAKTPLVAQRHLQSHFKRSWPSSPRLSSVVFDTDQTHGLRERIPGIASRLMKAKDGVVPSSASLKNATLSMDVSTAKTVPCEKGLDLPAELYSESKAEPSIPSPTVSRKDELPIDENLKIQGGESSLARPDELPIDANLVKIQGGESSLARPDELQKDIQKSIADFRSKLHESAGLALTGSVVVVGSAEAETTDADVVKSAVDDSNPPSASTREILESVKAQTAALAHQHRQTSGVVKSESSPASNVKSADVDCIVCDVALGLDRMPAHSALHASAFDIDRFFGSEDVGETDDGMESRIREKLDGFGDVEKRELARFLRELEEEEEEDEQEGGGSALNSKGPRGTCRYCCLEVDAGKLSSHESRHFATAAS